MQILSGIQFTRHSIEFKLWKRKNSIVLIHTWSWRSKHAASAQTCLREANAERWNFFFSVQNCSICSWYLYVRGESDLGPCTTSVLAKRIMLCGGDFWFKNVFGYKIRRNSPRRSGILFACTEIVTDLDPTLYTLILKRYGELAHQNKMLGVPQTYSSAGRMFAASRSRLHYYRRIVLFPQQRIQWNAS